MRPSLLTTACGALLALSLPALAQSTPAGTSAATPATGSAAPSSAPNGAPASKIAPDPVLAKVNDQEVHFTDLQAAAQSLPAELRQMPPQVLFPMLLEQVVDRDAVVIEAKKQGLQNDPAVQKQIAKASDTVLENAILQRDVAPKITEAAIRTKYDTDIAAQGGETEVHARHILVPTEEQAKSIIEQLKHGAKFEDLAKKYSTDPAAKSGGDLGFFKKDDMLPEFANVAFALKPGQVSQTPVHTRYGWHVIQVIETRVAKPKTFEQAHDELRQQLIQAQIQVVLAQARSQVKIQKFNPDGTPMKDDAAKPDPGLPAPGKPTAQ